MRNHVSVILRKDPAVAMLISQDISTCYIFRVVNINGKGLNEIFFVCLKTWCYLFKDMMLSIWINSLLLRSFTSACLLWVRCCEASCRPVYFDYFHLWCESLQRRTSKNKCFFQINNFLFKVRAQSLKKLRFKKWQLKRLYRHATQVRTLQSIYVFELVSHERSRFCSHLHSWQFALSCLHLKFHRSRECVERQNTHSWDCSRFINQM